jgi:hypothetical protein
LAALADYVVQVAQVVCEVDDERLIAAWKQFARSNPAFIMLLEARAISYWNAYYRTEEYANYPPYRYLEALSGR